MMKFTSFALTAAAGLTAVAAAIIPRAELSVCGQAIETLITSSEPGLGCLAPGALNDFIKLGSQNASSAAVADAVDHWLTNFCGVGTCSSDVLSQIGGNITAACGDVGTFNSTNFALSRELFCFKDTVANSFCTAESLKANSNSTGSASPEEMMLGLSLSTSVLGSTCNECTKARYQLAVKSGEPNFQAINDICGANFTATLNSTLVGITQTAVTSEFKNGAGTLAPTARLLLLAVVSGFIAV